MAPAQFIAFRNLICQQGSKFFYQSNGTEFFVRGVYYSPGVSAQLFNDSTLGLVGNLDVLASPGICARDAPLLLQLGANVITVSGLIATHSHAECLRRFAENDIYVIISFALTSDSVSPDHPTWDLTNYQESKGIIDEVNSFDNVLGFYAASNIDSTTASTVGLPFAKAAVRDLKAHIKDSAYRPIPVGYTSNASAWSASTIAYMNSGDVASSVDFYGQSIFTWCGNTSLSDSSWAPMLQWFSSYSVPAILSAYGCNEANPRTFQETLVLYGSEMTQSFSGGVVFEYFAQTDWPGYGELDAELHPRLSANLLPSPPGLVSGNRSSVEKTNNFGVLSSQFAKVSPSTVNAASYTPTNTKLAAIPSIASTFSAIPTLPPRVSGLLCSCMVATLNCTTEEQTQNLTAFAGIVSESCAAAEPGSCNGILADASSGTYGAYSMCLARQQAAWALNAAYGSGPGCVGSGYGVLKTPSPSNSSCLELLAQAGPRGVQTVTSFPTTIQSGTGHSGSSSGLSTGAQAGIGISVAVLFLAVVVGAVFLGWRYHKLKGKRKYDLRQDVNPLDGELSPHVKSELPASDKTAHATSNEREAHLLDGTGAGYPQVRQQQCQQAVELNGENDLPVESGGQEVLPETGIAHPGGVSELSANRRYSWE